MKRVREAKEIEEVCKKIKHETIILDEIAAIERSPKRIGQKTYVTSLQSPETKISRRFSTHLLSATTHDNANKYIIPSTVMLSNEIT